MINILYNDEAELNRTLTDLPQGAIVRSAYSEPGYEADVFQKGINERWCQTGWEDEITTGNVTLDLLYPFETRLPQGQVVVGYVIWC